MNELTTHEAESEGKRTMGENRIDDEWLEASKDSEGEWRGAVKEPVDWDFVNGLDLRGGIGLGDEDDPAASLSYDYDRRIRIETVLNSLEHAWMISRGTVRSYDLVRALAHANRRLSDEIDRMLTLVKPGEAPDDPTPGFESSLRSGATAWKRGMNAKGGDPNAWAKRYLPGRGVGEVVGIDLETTDLNPYRDYVIDAGYERMDMTGADHDGPASYPYMDKGYAVEGAYDQHRRTYGVSPERLRQGNPTEWLSGIGADELASHRPLDEDALAQSELLDVLTSAPYVAHNARFEHRHFMANVKGYAEAYRDGRVTIIDTMYMSRFWRDRGHAPANNKLQTYADQWGGLPQGDGERHLGLEDSHIMLVAMRNHLNHLRAENAGPWGPEGHDGIGGKTVTVW